MSSLVRANPILAQYVPKPTKGFATFGYQQGAQNVVEQQEATTALNAELEEVKTSEQNLKVAIDALNKKKEEYQKKVTERQAKEAEKISLANEVVGLQGKLSQAQSELQNAQADVDAANREKAERERAAAEAAARAAAINKPQPQQPQITYAPLTPVQDVMQMPPEQSRGVPSGVASIQPTMATVAPSVSTYQPQQVAQRSAFDPANKNVTSTVNQAGLEKIASQVAATLKNMSKEDFLKGFKYG